MKVSLNIFTISILLSVLSDFKKIYKSLFITNTKNIYLLNKNI